ncbi:DUF5320 domain-containing protein [Halodesulfovibrio marinisediminis]|uniref:Uncharacterized protein n=1 Tax=Halodesulfovibrio marinisediminis DSM 17456 TaxID=1121457 RepID=A0A1N6I9N9_9BACT|nr:DUF5320 domain-containing protein [Halodesulfovibrio marinisediminis]SIO28675.1 hypothetical protein SAMN02745161_2546 [Halodesulfovibrio marinisediminis DSM 17456]
MNIENLLNEVDMLEEQLEALNEQREELTSILGQSEFATYEEALAAAPAEVQEAMKNCQREAERAGAENVRVVEPVSSAKAPMNRRGMMRV